MLFGFTPSNQRRRTDEVIDDQIESMKERGIQFHYNRKTRKKSYDEGEISLRNRVKILKYIFLFIIVFCAFAFVLPRLLKHGSLFPGKGISSVEGELLTLEVEMKHTSYESIIIAKFIPKNETLLIPEGTAVSFTFYHSRENLETYSIQFPQEITITKDMPLSKGLYNINKAVVFRALGITVTSRELGISGTVRLR